MISIIISSRKAHLLDQVTRNAALTIGVPYEIIAVENPAGAFGICRAYNQGAARSRYGILCFMHEDILFHTPDWGRIVARVLADQRVGLVGIAGGTIKLRTPSPWIIHDLSFTRKHIIQHLVTGERVRELDNPAGETLADVVTLDGVWLCCRKEIWQNHPFDEKNFDGFHFYDIDFSMQVFRHYRVCVLFEVLIEHFSPGSFNHDWVKYAIRFSDKWRKHLPVAVRPLEAARMKQLEFVSNRKFISLLFKMNYARKYILRYVLRSFSLQPTSRTNLAFSREFVRLLLTRKTE